MRIDSISSRVGAILIAAFVAWPHAAGAATTVRRAPAGSFSGAPDEFTHFSARELSRGFLALAFGSDLRVGSALSRIHRFDRSVKVNIMANGSVDRRDGYRKILLEFAQKFPSLNLTLTDNAGDANFIVRLIDEKDFETAIESVFGRRTARAFVAKTDPQCMTSVQSAAEGGIVKVDSFIIVDQGDDVFFNCAYHEMLHAFGLSNHDQKNPWTALNQNRTVGYLTVYDHALLQLLYDPRVKSGMTRTQVKSVLPRVARDIASGL